MRIHRTWMIGVLVLGGTHLAAGAAGAEEPGSEGASASQLAYWAEEDAPSYATLAGGVTEPSPSAGEFEGTLVGHTVHRHRAHGHGRRCGCGACRRPRRLRGCGACGGAGCGGCRGGGCGACGGIGCGACMPHLAHLKAGPYGDGYCPPHWFDAHVDVMYLTREDISRRVDFSSEGIGAGDPIIVLSSESLDFDEEAGFRATATHQVGAATHLEASYFGAFDWASSAGRTSSNNLFSVFSDFGDTPFQGFDETGEADLHHIAYSSELHSAELNFRSHHTVPGYQIHGSWLMGIRYFRLEEDFTFFTNSTLNSGQMSYLVGTNNDLIGFQLGADMFACLLPGLQVGGQIKAGIFGNHAEQDTRIAASSLSPSVIESMDLEEAALVSEAEVMAVYYLRPWFTIRAGYQFLYVDGVALAIENFNSSPPELQAGGSPVASTRVPFINANGDAFYHGATAGIEWMW